MSHHSHRIVSQFFALSLSVTGCSNSTSDPQYSGTNPSRSSEAPLESGRPDSTTTSFQQAESVKNDVCRVSPGKGYVKNGLQGQDVSGVASLVIDDCVSGNTYKIVLEFDSDTNQITGLTCALNEHQVRSISGNVGNHENHFTLCGFAIDFTEQSQAGILRPRSADSSTAIGISTADGKDSCLAGSASPNSIIAVDGSRQYFDWATTRENCTSGNIYRIVHTVDPRTGEVRSITCQINGESLLTVDSKANQAPLDDSACGFEVY